MTAVGEVAFGAMRENCRPLAAEKDGKKLNR
jgi:hypothetical protein